MKKSLGQEHSFPLHRYCSPREPLPCCFTSGTQTGKFSVCYFISTLIRTIHIYIYIYIYTIYFRILKSSSFWQQILRGAKFDHTMPRTPARRVILNEEASHETIVVDEMLLDTSITDTISDVTTPPVSSTPSSSTSYNISCEGCRNYEERLRKRKARYWKLKEVNKSLEKVYFVRIYTSSPWSNQLSLM